jgi:hypothetical protein
MRKNLADGRFGPAQAESARSGGVLAWLLPLLISSLSISSRVRLLSEINFY